MPAGKLDRGPPELVERDWSGGGAEKAPRSSEQCDMGVWQTQWSLGSPASLEKPPPFVNGYPEVVDIEMIHNSSVGFEITFRESQQSQGGASAMFFQMDEGSGDLDQSLIKVAPGNGSALKPQSLEDFMGVEIATMVKGIEKADVTRIQPLAVNGLGRDVSFGTLPNHHE